MEPDTRYDQGDLSGHTADFIISLHFQQKCRHDNLFNNYKVDSSIKFYLQAATFLNHSNYVEIKVMNTPTAKQNL